jgi:branched-chain amino acid transport system permease protein
MFGLIVLVALTLLFTALPAFGQEAEQGLQSTLTYQNAEGERVPAAGVTIVVTDESGAEIGSATSDDAGAILIPVPTPGDYVASVDVDSLPEGISLRDPDRASLDVEVRSGEMRNVLFALVEGEGGVPASEGSGTASASLFFGLLFEGIKFGLIIAMCSVGLSLIYGTTGLTNFAHGELVAFGALVALALDIFGMPMLIAGPIAIVATAAFGAANEQLVWKPLRHRGTGLVSMLVISIGLSILLRYLYLYQAGGRRIRYSQFSLQTGIDVGPITIVPREIWIIVISVIALVIVAIGVKQTKIGKAMRAVSDNRDLAESSGIDVERVIMVVWVAGGALAGLGGVLLGLDQGVRWDMGSELLLLMFAAVTLGGLGTAYGPLLGGLVIGVFVNISTTPIGGFALPPELKNVGALFVLVVILLVRPQGILGQRERIG